MAKYVPLRLAHRWEYACAVRGCHNITSVRLEDASRAHYVPMYVCRAHLPSEVPDDFNV